VLHNDNAPRHTSLVIRQFLADKKLPCPHPPYSADLAPCNMWLFSKMKLMMKANRFAMTPEIEAAMIVRFRALTGDDFQSCFSSWQDYWNMCIDSEADYSEGD
jgi:hypothetical protein